VGQATRDRHGQRFAGGHAAGEFPDANAGTYTTAGAPPDTAKFAGPDGDAVSAADRDAAADRDTAYDEPACHRTADPDAHLVREHAGNALAAHASVGTSPPHSLGHGINRARQVVSGGRRRPDAAVRR